MINVADIKTIAEYRGDHFMEIVDMDLFNYAYEMYSKGEIAKINQALQLRIVRDNGIDVSKDFDVKVTDLNTDNKNVKFKQFTNTGDGGISFKIDVIIKTGEVWGYGVHAPADYEKKGAVTPAYRNKDFWIDYWYTHMRPLYVVTDAIDVPNGVYIITKNASRKQTFKEYTIWTLELTTFNPLNLYTWSVAQSISDALNPKTTTATSTTKAKQLKDCTASNIVYSKTEKKTDCNKLMQEKLYKLGFLRQDQIDSWYGPVTMEAVKKFQKWYNKKGHNLLVDGICGPVTLKALVSS